MKILAPIKSNQESARLPRMVEKVAVAMLAAFA